MISKKKIDESEKRIFDWNTGHWESETKQCLLYKKGYCNKEGSCVYFHSEEMCADHTENGVCIKRYCRKRHPKTCRYFLRGFCRRSSSCKYLHSKHNQPQSFNKCEKTHNQFYFYLFWVHIPETSMKPMEK